MLGKGKRDPDILKALHLDAAKQAAPPFERVLTSDDDPLSFPLEDAKAYINQMVEDGTRELKQELTVNARIGEMVRQAASNRMRHDETACRAFLASIPAWQWGYVVRHDAMWLTISSWHVEIPPWWHFRAHWRAFWRTRRVFSLLEELVKQ